MTDIFSKVRLPRHKPGFVALPRCHHSLRLRFRAGATSFFGAAALARFLTISHPRRRVRSASWNHSLSRNWRYLYLDIRVHDGVGSSLGVCLDFLYPECGIISLAHSAQQNMPTFSREESSTHICALG